MIKELHSFQLLLLLKISGEIFRQAHGGSEEIKPNVIEKDAIINKFLEADAISRTTASPEPFEEMEIAEKEPTTSKGEEEAEDGFQPAKT